MYKIVLFLLVICALLVGAYLMLRPTGENDVTIQLYYYNPELDKDEHGNIQCSREGLVPVERTIPETATPIEDTIKLLIEGNMTEDERERGITSEFPLQGFSPADSRLENGVLTLTFNDPQNRTTGGSCRVGILWSQIEATGKQFSNVIEVHFMPEELFQP